MTIRIIDIEGSNITRENGYKLTTCLQQTVAFNHRSRFDRANRIKKANVCARKRLIAALKTSGGCRWFGRINNPRLCCTNKSDEHDLSLERSRERKVP